MRWITRARPKIDRIACPWLIHRFIDPRAEFFYVPTERVFEEGRRLQAVPYDIPGAPISHEGELCSFDTLLRAFDLLTRAESEIRTAAQPRYHLEMALLRWLHLRKLVPLTELIEQMKSGGSAVSPAGQRRGSPASADAPAALK